MRRFSKEEIEFLSRILCDVRERDRDVSDGCYDMKIALREIGVTRRFENCYDVECYIQHAVSNGEEME
jgi:hypothetical protein